MGASKPGAVSQSRILQPLLLEVFLELIFIEYNIVFKPFGWPGLRQVSPQAAWQGIGKPGHGNSVDEIAAPLAHRTPVLTPDFKVKPQG